MGLTTATTSEEIPRWYPRLLADVSEQIHGGRSRAVRAANTEMLVSYWNIGRNLLERENEEGWGSQVVTRLASDIRDQFPDARGFSPRNLRYMKSFAQAWPDVPMLQRSVATLPGRHHIALLEKLNDTETRLWYAAAAVENGWSRDILVHQIEIRLHERSGKAISNFIAVLPPADSDLAQQATKDPYFFDFLAVTEQVRERDLENLLVAHVEKFLLELGQGFAFVGRQVRLELGEDDFYADLLFYHLRLRCFVVIELKAVAFDPAFIGQLGMYMAAVDDLMTHDSDKPTIGLLLCKTKNNVVAEYALRNSKAPIGVAEWTNAIIESLPDELKSNLPSIETIEAELGKDADNG